MDQTIISVLILSYNHVDYVEACITSAVAQTSENLKIEVLIIDDGSNDGTHEVLQRLEKQHDCVRVYCQEHEGVNAIAKNFNRLISYATGDYLTFLSSDDELIECRFDSSIAVMNSDPDIQLVYCDGINRSNGIFKNRITDHRTAEVLRNGDLKAVYQHITENIPLLFIQGLLVRRNFFSDFLPFDEDLIADDWVFNIRCFIKLINTRGRFVFIDEVVFIRNLLPKRTSNDLPVHWDRVRQVIERYTPKTEAKILKKKALMNFIKRAFRQRKYWLACVFVWKYYLVN